MKKVEYRYITVYTDDKYPEIIFGTYSPRLEIDLRIAQELIENRLAFLEGKSAYALIDFTNVRSVTKEARDYMNCKEGGLKGILGGAFLSNNVVATLFINLYLKINKPHVPAKFFTNREEALKWLRQIRLTNTQYKNSYGYNTLIESKI
jgi:hypothetical protein